MTGPSVISLPGKSRFRYGAAAGVGGRDLVSILKACRVIARIVAARRWDSESKGQASEVRIDSRQGRSGRSLFPLTAALSDSPRQRRSSRALVTTLTLLKAMAAPATTGLSRPSAASGIPSTL